MKPGNPLPKVNQEDPKVIRALTKRTVDDIMDGNITTIEKIEMLNRLNKYPATVYGPYVNACLNMAQGKLNSNDMRLLTEDEKNKVEALNEHNKMDLLNEIIRYTGLPLLFKYIWKIGSSPMKQLNNLYYNLNYNHNAANKLMDNHVSIKLDSGNNYHYDEHETVHVQHAGMLSTQGDQIINATTKSDQLREGIKKELEERKETHAEETPGEQEIRQKEELIENLEDPDQKITPFSRELRLNAAKDKLVSLKKEHAQVTKRKNGIREKLKGALETKREPGNQTKVNPS